MELYKEIRAFYIKMPRPISADSHKIIEALWSMSKDIRICSIDIKNDEILIHSEIEFSLENWEASVRYLKCAILLFKKKYGYIIIRKVSASKEGLKTGLESYKVTKRGVYNSELSGPKCFIEDILKFSGRNKSLQFADAMGKIFSSIEEPDKEKDNEEL